MERAEEPWGDVPKTWVEAAEEVREHLCGLRGNALFLSPTDGWLLMTWLEQGVPVSAIIVALERASESRKRSRSKVPLTLAHAKRHLGKPPARPRHVSGATVADPAALSALDRALDGIDGTGETALRNALALVRAFFDATWDAWGPAGRSAARKQASEALGDLLSFVDASDAEALVDERARDILRSSYPSLSAGALSERFEVRHG